MDTPYVIVTEETGTAHWIPGTEWGFLICLVYITFY